MIELKGKYNKDCKIFIDDIETEAIGLIQSILDQPVSKDVPVRIMPDTHAGKGIVIGFTMPMTTMIKPEWVGVDINCGMLSARFNSQTPLNLELINNKIRELVPMGFDIYDESFKGKLPFDDIQKIADIFTRKFNEKFGTTYIAPTYNEKWLSNKLKAINMDVDKFYKSIGTLGGGNHFIEIGQDENGNYWVTVHTGSRNFGLKIAEYWSNVANGKTIKTPKAYDDEFRHIVEHTIPSSDIPKKIKELKDKYNLGVNKEYLQDDDMFGYLMDMIFAQKYAELNRSVILNQIGKALNMVKFDETIECAHNYINFNDFIIRKGAISAYENEKVIIPWNMRDGLIIARGKSNVDWNYSAPHGAGRLMSRSKAKELVNLNDFKETMKDVYSTSVTKSTLDESPFAYKDSDVIRNLVEPTVEIIHTVKPILNIKDNSEGLSWKERKKQKNNNA